MRLDKWLWAARFFKTRSLAKAAVEGGKVHVDGARVKAARAVRPGDALEITRGQVRWEVIVEALNEQRRPAPEAQALYRETAQSIERREREAEERRLHRETRQRKPGKRDRRRLERLKRGPGAGDR